MSQIISTISREELWRKMANKDEFLLVETLPPFMFHAGHLPGALNLPPDAVFSSALTVLPDKSAEIILYCHDRHTSACLSAARILLALGYESVRLYSEGKQGWAAAGLPIEGAIVPQPRWLFSKMNARRREQTV